MTDLKKIVSPITLDLVVAFSDLTGFARFSRTKTREDLFDFISGYYEFTGDIIEQAGGTVVKYIGDSILIAYPEEIVDDAVLNLISLKDSGDQWLRGKGSKCKHIIKVHCGAVICGEVGSGESKRFDIFGDTVNNTALLQSHGYSMTPQLFRKLNSNTRKYFKKHTPPITYIPIEERHTD
ncbi:adenylate/guanylate cyclase domain-containing protein [Thermodesulfobacteriota bacterium]